MQHHVLLTLKKHVSKTHTYTHSLLKPYQTLKIENYHNACKIEDSLYLAEIKQKLKKNRKML